MKFIKRIITDFFWKVITPLFLGFLMVIITVVCVYALLLAILFGSGWVTKLLIPDKYLLSAFTTDISGLFPLGLCSIFISGCVIGLIVLMIKLKKYLIAIWKEEI